MHAPRTCGGSFKKSLLLLRNLIVGPRYPTIGYPVKCFLRFFYAAPILRTSRFQISWQPTQYKEALVGGMDSKLRNCRKGFSDLKSCPLTPTPNSLAPKPWKRHFHRLCTKHVWKWVSSSKTVAGGKLADFVGLRPGASRPS